MISSPNIRYGSVAAVDRNVTAKAQSAYYMFANQLELGGISSSQRKFRIRNHIITILTTRNHITGFITGQIRISYKRVNKEDNELCEIYLESGFYDLISTGICSEGAYLPPILYYDTETSAYIDSLDEPLQGNVTLEIDELLGQPLLSGSISTSISCSEPLPYVTDPCGTGYGEGGYCEGIQEVKEVQEKIPSSMFSGKLRLYIQSVYGSTRRDYARTGFTLELGDLTDVENLDIFPVITFPKAFEESHWLYTTDKYDYFLCTYSSSTILFQPLALSPCAVEFRDILINHPEWSVEQKTKTEAYILAYSRITTESSITIDITGDIIQGSPLDYGWHSKWKGDIVNSVCFYVDEINDEYISDQHEITITETWDGVGYSFTANNSRLQSDMSWWPWTNTLNLFYYDESVGSMVPVELRPGKIGVEGGVFDSPVYNYYSRDNTTGVEELHTVNIYMNIDGSPANININLTGDKYYDTSEHVYQSIITYDGGLGTKGFKVGGSILNINVSSTSFKTQDTAQFVSYIGMDATSVGAYGNGGNANTISDDATLSSYGYMTSLGLSPGDTKEVPPKTYHLKFIHYRFLWSIEQDQYLNGDSSQGEGFMQTILGDCSNVILSSSVLEAHGGRKVVQTGSFSKYLGGHLYWTDSPAFTVPPVTESIGDMPGPVFVFPLPTYSGSSPGVETNTPADAGTAVLDLKEYKGGTPTIPVLTNESILLEYFQPTLGDPKTGTIDTGRESIGSKYKITHSAFSTDGGFIYDSSTGWV